MSLKACSKTSLDFIHINQISHCFIHKTQMFYISLIIKIYFSKHYDIKQTFKNLFSELKFVVLLLR